MVTILVLGCFIPFLMVRSWVNLIRHPGVLSIPNRFPGESDVGIQKVDCWEVGLYDNIWRWWNFIPHYTEVTYVVILRNTDVWLT